MTGSLLIGHVLVFSALRVFAICNRSYVWSLLVVLLGLIPIIMTVVCLHSCFKKH